MADIPVYRVALKDSSHPMYSIAWDVFREKFNTEKIAQKYADRRDEILPFLYAILDEEELYYFWVLPQTGYTIYVKSKGSL